jgi:hypothetical protein
VNLKVIKKEYVFGPSASSVRHLMSHSDYQICKDEDNVTLTFKEIKHLNKTLSAIIKRDKSQIKIK